MKHHLNFFLIYSTVFLLKNVLSDLPSCARAKCSHCKVPFIAQMCPMSCSSGCPMMSQNFLTAERPAKISSLEELNRANINAVPYAKQIPNSDSSVNHNNRDNILIPSRNNFNNNNLQQPFLQQTIFSPQPQFNNGWQNSGNFVQQVIPAPNNQQLQSPHFPQTTQQTTNFGGFYGEQGGNFQQIPPQRPDQQNFNPFQPFLQQPFQTISQPQSPLFPSIPAPAVGQITQQNGQFFENRGQIQNGQFPIASQNRPNFIASQQNFVQPTNDATQSNSFHASSNNQPILHAVANVADPLQRPRQLYNLPQPVQESQGKWNEGKVFPYQKNSATIGTKMPERTKFPVDEKKCPKPNWKPCVAKEIANQRFRNCCSRLGEGCAELCSYDQNLTTVQLAVLTGRCPVQKVGDLMICASGYEDATACCQAFGVFEPGFEHCRPYCNPAGGLPNDGMLAEKYRCLQKLQQIQQCFYLTQRP